MCGLFGRIMLKPDPTRSAVMLTTLGLYMDRRGGHSYGFLADGHLVKNTGTWEGNARVHDISDAQFVMAHTRAASVGKICQANAHPFEIGDVIGCHNGGIGNWSDLNKKYERDFEVDSMHIFAHLNEDKPLSELKGWGAYTFMRKSQPNRLNLMRAISGSLEIVWIKDGDERVGVAWASTWQALRSAVESAGYKAEDVRPESDVLHWVDTAVPEANPYEVYYDKSARQYRLGGREYTYTPVQQNGVYRPMPPFTDRGPGGGGPPKTASTAADRAETLTDAWMLEHGWVQEGGAWVMRGDNDEVVKRWLNRHNVGEITASEVEAADAKEKRLSKGERRAAKKAGRQAEQMAMLPSGQSKPTLTIIGKCFSCDVRTNLKWNEEIKQSFCKRCFTLFDKFGETEHLMRGRDGKLVKVSQSIEVLERMAFIRELFENAGAEDQLPASEAPVGTEVV